MKYRLCDGVSIEDVEGNQILVTAQGDAAILNDTAADIVERIVDGFEDNVLSDYISEKYEVKKEIACDDIEQLISDLQDKRFIKKQWV